MAGLTVDTSEIRGNPLDVLEELVDANEWRFDRNSAEEMLVELSGRWCDYRLYFIWQEDLSAISFSCIVDLRVPSHRRASFLELLGAVNEKLWLGHFDLGVEEPVPMFRHTILLRGLGAETLIITGAWTNMSIEHTARHAADAGYRAVVASDGTSTVNDEWQNAALSYAMTNVATVATCAEIAEALAG